jgi:hypothetical protein
MRGGQLIVSKETDSDISVDLANDYFDLSENTTDPSNPHTDNDMTFMVDEEGKSVIDTNDSAELPTESTSNSIINSAPTGSRYWSMSSQQLIPVSNDIGRYSEGVDYNFADLHPAHILPTRLRSQVSVPTSDQNENQTAPKTGGETIDHSSEHTNECENDTEHASAFVVAPVTIGNQLDIPLLTSKDMRGYDRSIEDWLEDESLKAYPDYSAGNKVYDPTPLTDPVHVPSNDTTLKQLSPRDRALWERSRASEWHGMWEINNTFDRTPVPIGEARKKGSVLHHLWVYTKRADGRLKSRLTCRGDQERGHEPGSWTSPMITYTLVMLLMLVGLGRNWTFAVLDVQQAFLKAPISRDVYMYPPPHANCQWGYVLKIIKSLYGLGDASQQWFILLSSVLRGFGMKQSETHPCVFFSTSMIVMTFVDDMPIFAAAMSDIERLRSYLLEQLIETTLQTTKGRLLGMGFTYNGATNEITLDFKEYKQSLLNRFEANQLPTKLSPFPTGLRLVREPTRGSHPRYREAVGSLLHLCKLDWTINNAVRDLCRYADFNGPTHWRAIQHLMGYIKHSLEHCVHFRGSNSTGFDGIIVWSDATWADGSQDGRGVSGDVFVYRGHVFAARSRTQAAVSRSSCESELIAISDAVHEIRYFRRLLLELGENLPSMDRLYSDSQSALALLQRPLLSTRSRHLNIRRLGVAQLVEDGALDPIWVKTTSMIADPLTKHISRMFVGQNSQRLRNVVPSTAPALDRLPEEGCCEG